MARLAGHLNPGRTDRRAVAAGTACCSSVLIGTYLLASFGGTLATEVQVVLFAAVLLIALRTSPLPSPWPVVIGAVTIARHGGDVLDVAERVPDREGGRGPVEGPAAADRGDHGRAPGPGQARGHHPEHLRRAQRLPDRRPDVRLDLRRPGLTSTTSGFFADDQPANTQTFQYFSFTTLTTLGYGDFTAAQDGGRSIAMLEALTGQVFLATLVARLVSAYRGPSEQ